MINTNNFLNKTLKELYIESVAKKSSSVKNKKAETISVSASESTDSKGSKGKNIKVSDDDDDSERHIHDGHRQRLISTATVAGLDSLSDVQAVECLLFLVFPRGDVNPLAHRLLKRFDNFTNILEASVEDLMEVKGINKMSAMKIHLFLEFFNFYSFEKIKNKNNIKTIGEFYDYLEQLLRYKSEEEMYLFGVNPNGEIVKGRRFAKGNSNLVGIDLHDISLYISSNKVKAVFLVHNHPDGTAIASKLDISSYEDLQKKFDFAGCKLLDSLIVGKDGIYSSEKRLMQRVFGEGLEYMQSIIKEIKTKIPL